MSQKIDTCLDVTGVLPGKWLILIGIATACMIRFSAIVLGLSFLVCLAAPVTAQVPVSSVGSVDLARYVGKWYEIASFPMFFQRNCVGDTTAEYALTPDGTVAVTNRCRKDDGFDEAHGKAVPVEGTHNAQLKVTFFWPFYGDYWVIGLDSEYRWALVGNPNRKYLWILSRTPQLSEELLTAALSIANAQGYDLTQLRYTRQSEVPATTSH